MAGVLELIKANAPRQLVGSSKQVPWVNPKTLELQAAMEILSEVFGLRITEVEEMLLERSEAKVQSYGEKGGLWPESFHIEQMPSSSAGPIEL
jgi:hypothetical protein